MKPIAIDLFCGAGGMSEGVIQAGFHIVFSSDVNESVKKTYMNRHEQLGYIQGINTYFQQADIRDLNGKKIIETIQQLECFEGMENVEIDAIFGGPPCQGFSRAGLRKKNDPRNMLFKEYIRVIKEIQPKYVIMENVEGMKDTKLDEFVGVNGSIYPDNTMVLELLENEFKQIGYQTLEPQILDATDFGVPQKRKRLIYLAYRNDQPMPHYPEKITEKEKVTVVDAIGDLIKDSVLRQDINSDRSLYQIQSQKGRSKKEENFMEIYNHELSNHSELIIERLSLYEQGETAAQLRKRIQKDGITLKKKPHLLKWCGEKLNLNQKEIIDTYQKGNLSDKWVDVLLTRKNSRTRLHPHQPAPTMLTNGDDYIHPYENRALTVREMARLQSFDDQFEFLGKRTTGGLKRRIEVPQYTQVGNAVPPLLSKAIASEIIKILKKDT